MADQPPRRSDLEYEQLGVQNVVIEQGEYRRWVRDQVGRSISGQLAVLVSLLGSGGFLAIAAAAFTYVNYQRDIMERELEENLEAAVRFEVEREVGYQVARAITDATEFAGDLANSVSRDPVLRRQFFEELFTTESVGALTGVAAGQRAIDPEAPPAIRRFALSQVAVFGPELLPGVAAELLIGDDAPRELYDQALEYYDRYDEGGAPSDLDVGSSGGRADEGLFLRLTRVGLILAVRGADWRTVHDQVVGRVLDRMLGAGGDESCEASPAYCAFFANLTSEEAEVAFARFAMHLRGEGKNELWDAAHAPLAAVDGTRGLLSRAPALYADARAGNRIAELDAVLQMAIGRFELTPTDGFATTLGPTQAAALEALDGALAEGAIEDREAVARLVGLRIAGLLDVGAAAAAESPVDAFAPRAPNELTRIVRSLQRAAADGTATNQRRAAALRTLKLMLAVAPEASPEYRLSLEMVDFDGLSPPGEALAAPTRAVLEELRARARSVYAWRDDNGAHRGDAVELGRNGGTLASTRWGRIDLTAPELAGDLAIVIDVAAPLVGYVVVGADGAVADGALTPPDEAGRTQILIDRADLKSDTAYIRFEPVDAAAPVEVSAAHRPPIAPLGAGRGGAADLALEAAYRVEPDAVNGTQAWLRFTAATDGFYRLGLLSAGGGGQSLRVAVYASGQDEPLSDQTLSGGFTDPARTFLVTAGESYDILLEGRGVTSSIGLRLRPGAGARIGVGETRRLALEGSSPVLVSTPRLETGIYRIQTLELSSGADTVLELSNSRGQVLGSDDDGGEEPLASALSFTVRSEDSYIASIRGYGDETRGDFSVQLIRTGDWTGEVASLAPGQNQRLSFAVVNPIEISLPDLPSGEYRIYTYDLASDVDTVLELFTAEGQSLSSDDDGGEEPLASSLTFRSEDESFLASIRSYGDVGPGEFSVQLDRVGD
jgi:hypothetical protein